MRKAPKRARGKPQTAPLRRGPKIGPLFTDEEDLREFINQMRYEAECPGADTTPCTLMPWLRRELTRILVESGYRNLLNFDPEKLSDLSLSLSALPLNNLQRPVVEVLLRIGVNDGILEPGDPEFIAERLARIYAITLEWRAALYDASVTGGKDGAAAKYAHLAKAKDAALAEYGAAIRRQATPTEFATEFLSRLLAKPSEFGLVREQVPLRQTIIDWVSELAPPELKKRGRPRKK